MAHIPRPEARAAIISLSVGVLLLAIKFVGYFLTGSSAIFSDALESIVNVVSAGVALYSLSLAHSPADPEHPYGHGKAEFISAGFEGGMIIIAALIILFETVSSLVANRGPNISLNQLHIGIGLVGCSIFLNGIVGLYLIRIGKTQNSIALEADGRHLITDAISSLAVLVALIIVSWTKWTWADPIAAFIIAIYIARIGLGLMKRSLAGLMDEQDVTDQRLLKKILDAHLGPAGKPPLICSYHKLRHRHSGRYHWVDFHIMVPSRLSVQQGHDIASAIEYEIEQSLGPGNATAHIEPCVDETCGNCNARTVMEGEAPAEPRV